MKSKFAAAALCGLLLIGCAACSPAPKGQDPAQVKLELAAEPAPVKTGTPTKLTATITGLENTDAGNVQFEIRRSDNSGLPDTKEASPVGGGRYTAEETFDKTGKYSIYIHIYQGDLHITKKKELEVS
ncbi:FixH family protein [Paenibacillus thalictri]|uniref:Ig-like domain repeat protein n=1 Tax=Paenibacillus thalictri TaxID=2527873 RepID=A0A4Q9E0N0_9BACL|nr:FixH family protein [Paenibacillus thalictri]TBL81101.1 Ig-like domain repeat protein [Paenibacillus thalictri]